MFGILKGRFRILKTGIRVHGLLATDRIWLTCCALHNYLLVSDGLSTEWNRGVPSEYEGEMGQIRTDDLEELPVHSRDRRFDISGMGRGNDFDPLAGSPEQASPEQGTTDGEPAAHVEENTEESTVFVHKLRLETFRKRLVEHFDILFTQNKVKWPSRTGESIPPTLQMPEEWTNEAVR